MLLARVATVLHTPGCCSLVGPTKLLRGAPAVALLHTGDGPVNRLVKTSAAEEEFCESIDRY